MPETRDYSFTISACSSQHNKTRVVASTDHWSMHQNDIHPAITETGLHGQPTHVKQGMASPWEAAE